VRFGADLIGAKNDNRPLSVVEVRGFTIVTGKPVKP
jgi:hypothetical protein